MCPEAGVEKVTGHCAITAEGGLLGAKEGRNGIIIPHSHTRKLRLREVKLMILDHTVTNGRAEIPAQGCFALTLMFTLVNHRAT